MYCYAPIDDCHDIMDYDIEASDITIVPRRVSSENLLTKNGKITTIPSGYNRITLRVSQDGALPLDSITVTPGSGDSFTYKYDVLLIKGLL